MKAFSVNRDLWVGVRLHLPSFVFELGSSEFLYELFSNLFDLTIFSSITDFLNIDLAFKVTKLQKAWEILESKLDRVHEIISQLFIVTNTFQKNKIRLNYQFFEEIDLTQFNPKLIPENMINWTKYAYFEINIGKSNLRRSNSSPSFMIYTISQLELHGELDLIFSALKNAGITVYLTSYQSEFKALWLVSQNFSTQVLRIRENEMIKLLEGNPHFNGILKKYKSSTNPLIEMLNKKNLIKISLQKVKSHQVLNAILNTSLSKFITNNL